MEKFELIPSKNILLEYHYTHYDSNKDNTKYVKVLKFLTIHSSDYNNLPNPSSSNANNILPIYLYINPREYNVYTKDLSHIIYYPDERPFLFSISNFTDASTYITTVKINSNIQLEKSTDSIIPYIFAFDENDCLCFYVRHDVNHFSFTLKVLNEIYNKINEYIEINDVYDDKNVVSNDSLTLLDINLLPIFENNSDKDSLFNNRTSKTDNIPTVTKCFYNEALFFCKESTYYAIPAYRITEEIKFYGTYNERPTTGTRGFPYFCTDKNIMIFYSGGRGIWITADGLNVEIKRSGSFSEKPTDELGIPVGFQYFCTDMKTPEGNQQGVYIYHKGGDIWTTSDGIEVTSVDSLVYKREGTTEERPTSPPNGFVYRDTTLNKLIWYFNGKWYDNAGAEANA